LQAFGSGRGDGGSLGFSGGASPVPEPAAFGLMGAGLLMLAAVVRRRLHTPLQ
jgi:PEP-CTERM motif